MNKNLSDNQYGLLVKGIAGFYYVERAGIIHECKARGIFRKQNCKPLPGDHVKIKVDNDGYDIIDSICERKNTLQRPPISNVDILAIVSSIKDPDINLFLVNQLITIATIKGIEPILIITKEDLADVTFVKKIYENIGIKVFVSSPKNDIIVDEFKNTISGKICVLAGNSGVGKSTFINKLSSQLNLQTGETSKKLGRGRHTTRQVELFKLGNGYIADTPGFSSLDITTVSDIKKENLQFGFAEFQKYSSNCKFTTCSHTSEKGCAVIQAVTDGYISCERYNNYKLMYDNIKDLKSWKKKKSV